MILKILCFDKDRKFIVYFLYEKVFLVCLILKKNQRNNISIFLNGYYQFDFDFFDFDIVFICIFSYFKLCKCLMKNIILEVSWVFCF